MKAEQQKLFQEFARRLDQQPQQSQQLMQRRQELDQKRLVLAQQHQELTRLESVDSQQPPQPPRQVQQPSPLPRGNQKQQQSSSEPERQSSSSTSGSSVAPPRDHPVVAQRSPVSPESQGHTAPGAGALVLAAVNAVTVVEAEDDECDREVQAALEVGSAAAALEVADLAANQGRGPSRSPATVRGVTPSSLIPRGKAGRVSPAQNQVPSASDRGMIPIGGGALVLVSEPPCGSGAGPSRPESAPAATLSQQGGGIPYHRYDLETYLALDPLRRPRFWTKSEEVKRQEICKGLNSLSVDHEAVVQARTAGG